MGDVVSDATEFSCPFCTTKLKITVPSSSAKGSKKALATTTNSLFPPPPGGQCLVCPSAPVPCTPSVNNIDPGQSAWKIDGAPALGAGCKFMCAKGGLLTVSSPGQTKAKHEGASAADIALSLIPSTRLIKGLKMVKNVVKAVQTVKPKASSPAKPPPTQPPANQSNAPPPTQKPPANAQKTSKPPPRTEPRTLQEKLALEEAKGGAGKPIEKLEIKDPNYPADKFVKMEHVHKAKDQNVDIHYWLNKETGEMSGFKFKDYDTIIR